MYKLYLRNQKQNAARCITESLSECFGNKNQTQFCKIWKGKFGSRNSQACSIDGLDNPVDIANKFADVFADACSPFSAEHFNTAWSKFFDKRFDLLPCNMSRHLECSISFFNDIIQKLKRNKAASLDGLAHSHSI